MAQKIKLWERKDITPLAIKGKLCLTAFDFAKIIGKTTAGIFHMETVANRVGDRLKTIKVRNRKYYPISELTRYKFTGSARKQYYKLDEYGNKKVFLIGK